MNPVPALAITLADGEITIDAELLAPKLGLSGAALKAEMRKGNCWRRRGIEPFRVTRRHCSEPVRPAHDPRRD